MDPFSLILILAVAGIGVYAVESGAVSATNSSGGDAPVDPAVQGIPTSLLAPTSSANVFTNSNFGFTLYDVAPSGQQGVYKRDYDDFFLNASVRTGVPFALIKAHAITESSLNASAARTEPTGRKSYGLMQVLWWPNSNRFANWGYTDDQIGDGSMLYDPEVNTYLGAMFIQDGLQRLGSLDDAINCYNTGVAMSVRVAPLGYVDKVKKYYSTLIGQAV